MKYKINDAYLIVNGESIPVGVVLGRDNEPRSPYMTECIMVSEYERGLKEFKYGEQKINNLVFYTLGEFVDFKATRHIDEKWIEELRLMGYDISRLVNVDEDKPI